MINFITDSDEVLDVLYTIAKKALAKHGIYESNSDYDDLCQEIVLFAREFADQLSLEKRDYELDDYLNLLRWFLSRRLTRFHARLNRLSFKGISCWGDDSTLNILAGEDKTDDRNLDLELDVKKEQAGLTLTESCLVDEYIAAGCGKTEAPRADIYELTYMAMARINEIYKEYEVADEYLNIAILQHDRNSKNRRKREAILRSASEKLKTVGLNLLVKNQIVKN